MVGRNTNVSLGYLSIFLCCITSAISFVFIAHLNKSHNEMLSIAITFSYAAILFNLFNINKIRWLYASVIENFKLILRMNLVTFINWLTTFLSFNYLDPATVICINLSVLTVTLFFILKPIKNVIENKHLIFSILLILSSMVLVIKQHMGIVSHTDTIALTLGVALSVVGGISGAFIGINSEGMGKAGFSVTQILATRFYLLITISSIAFFIFPHSQQLVIDWKYYLFSSLIIVIFPLVMYQSAVRSLGALIVSLLEPFTPVITYFLQVFVGDYQFNLITAMLLIISSCAVMWFVRIEQKIGPEKELMDEGNTLELGSFVAQ